MTNTPPLDSTQPVLNDSTRYSIRYEERLAMALNFNLDDLTANRLGAITGRQANRMRIRMLSRVRDIAIAVVIAVVAIALLIALRGSLAESAANIPLILIAVVLIGLLAFVVQRGLSAYQLYKDTQSRRSATSQGFLGLDGTAADPTAVQQRRLPLPSRGFHAVIDGKRFEISETAFLAMKKGEPYVLYYAPLSKSLLSAERLRNEREFSNNGSARTSGRAEVQLSRP
jgi:hypothetical protein